MTEDEIAGESGGTVSSRMVRGVRVLSGTGVIYGGTRSEQADVSDLVSLVVCGASGTRACLEHGSG